MKTTLSHISICVLLALAPISAFAQNLSLKMIADTVEDTYRKSIQEQFGVDFKITLNHKEPRYFGGATLTATAFEINIGAQILKLPSLTADAATLILCHELGHLLAGGPKKPFSTWASTEAQSDDFAARICAPLIFSALEKQWPGSQFEIFASMQDRTAQAAIHLIDAIYIFMNVPQMPRPSLTTPTTQNLSNDVNSYPTLQCRLDILVAGAFNQPQPKCW